jgi:hypothetical protein
MRHECVYMHEYTRACAHAREATRAIYVYREIPCMPMSFAL